MAKINLYDLSLAKLTELMKDQGEPAYRAKQIFEWLYQKDGPELKRMSNLPATLRRKLEEIFTTTLPRLEEIVAGSDGTEKLLIQLAVDEKKQGSPRLKIESVLMPYEDRVTLCISSQVGCALDCTFCATATMGFKRNLSPSEILGQVIISKRRLAERDRRLSNIVFMGMGEPLLNFDNLCIALENLTSKSAFAMSPSRITVSTAGVASRLSELAERFPVNIAISLNAPVADLRRKIMPSVAKRHALDELLKAAKTVGQSRRKPVTFEYVLLAAVTDKVEQARELVKLLKGIHCKINLIPFNPFPGSKFKRPEPQEVIRFQKILWDADIPAYIRWSQGLDVNAACGQLAVSSKS